MNIIENLKSALQSISGHKMRSGLTMLGIIIGISSVIMIQSLGNGVKNTVFDAVDNINKRMIQVFAWNISSWDDQMTIADGEAIARIPSVDKVTSGVEYYRVNMKLRQPDTVKEGSLFGTDENYNIVEDVNISIGRFISREDVENHSNVAVISNETAFQVFGYVNCIGEKIEIETWYGVEEFSVVGVLKASDENMLSMMMNTPISRSVAIIPVTTINDMFGWGDVIDFFGVTVLEDFSTTEAAQNITRLLDIRHNTVDGYYAESMEASFDEIDGILSAVTGFVGVVAFISLIVGGVGVMNIMLVTVKERTREIGTRKSLGASNGNILFQFLMEAVILSMLGGVIGIVMGNLTASGIGMVITSLMDMAVVPVISAQNISSAVSTASIVGIVSGVYPAYKAAKLNPIDALRYE